MLFGLVISCKKKKKRKSFLKVDSKQTLPYVAISGLNLCQTILAILLKQEKKMPNLEQLSIEKYGNIRGKCLETLAWK